MDRKAFHGVMPKTSYYRTDGSGRDTYISYDNGGTFQPMSNINSFDKVVLRPKSAVTKTAVRSLHYVCDGSGRDSYIRISDGGLHSPSVPQHFLTTFKSSLRDYQPIKIVSDPFSWTQATWKTTKHRFFSRTNNRKVQDCVSRLYTTNKLRTAAC